MRMGRDLVNHCPGEGDQSLVQKIRLKFFGNQSLGNPFFRVLHHGALNLITIVAAVVHALYSQGKLTCFEALIQQGCHFAHSQNRGQSTLQIGGRYIIPFFCDGEADHLQAGIPEDFLQTVPVRIRLVGLQALRHAGDHLFPDGAVGAKADQQRQVVVRRIHLVDDLIVEALCHNDTAIVFAGIQSLIQDGRRESPEMLPALKCTRVGCSWVLRATAAMSNRGT